MFFVVNIVVKMHTQPQRIIF